MSPIGKTPLPEMPDDKPIRPERQEKMDAPQDPTQPLEAVDGIPLMNNPDAFDQIASEVAVREVKLPDDSNKSSNDDSRPATISEAIDSGTDLTDMQFAAMKLFPEDKADLVSNISMVARIDPEVFLPLLHINVQNEIMTSDPFKPINVDKIVAKHYYRQSIGLEGRGRIDYAELAGASREAKERSMLSSGLGGMAS
jgi:hypothetical protein